MSVEPRAEGPKNGAREETGERRNKRLESGAQQLRLPTQECRGNSGAAATNPKRRGEAGLPRIFRRRAMYENWMEAAVAEENYTRALKAVKRNKGAAGIDRMTTAELEPHLQANWWILQDKLLKGTYVPSPVRRVEIPKPNGGTRMLGIPTVQDRF